MKTILTLVFILITYSPKADPPPLVQIGDTANEVLQRYGKPNRSEKVNMSGLFCWEWYYLEPKFMVRFRLDKVIYIE